MAKRMTLKDFITRSKELHGDKYDYSKACYINSKTKIEIVCPKHGSFWQIPQDHYLKGCGCPKCKGEKTKEVHSYKKEDWLKLVIDKYGDKYDYSKVEYIDYESPVTIICPIHGEFITKPVVHLKSVTGCPKCGREKANKSESSTTELFIEKASKKHNNRYNYSKVKYISQSFKVDIICPKHGVFKQLPGNHLQGQGCPRCNYFKSQNILYEKLKESFNNEDILFEVGNQIVEWIGKQRFDIYFPKYNIAVEYNGRQHYVPVEYFGGVIAFKEQQKYDELKRQKCKNNKCHLFEVKYNYAQEDYQTLVKDIQNIINSYNNG